MNSNTEVRDSESFNETARRISEITDTGAFEALASSVLRWAYPGLYSNLTQPGINPEGKTVRSPLDGICFIPGATPRHMIAVHHTSGSRKGLRAKWLFDPMRPSSKVIAKSTKEPGDLIKTSKIVIEERKSTPNLQVTLALTTNKEPSEDLIRDVEAEAANLGIVLDIWSCRRLADYLDNTPDGQWLRGRFLGINQERISRKLLLELSERSLRTTPSVLHAEHRVFRQELDESLRCLSLPVAFLVGESGFGKSTACFDYMEKHLRKGGCGLIISHESFQTATTIDQAIEKCLAELHPGLISGSGSQALALCSTSNPLLLIIEDVNRCQHVDQIVRRLVTWSSAIRDPKYLGHQAWQIICPIWPQLLSVLELDVRKLVDEISTNLGRFSSADATAALLQRSSSEGIDITTVEAQQIARALDFDPLLIGLHDLGMGANAGSVIQSFVQQCAERLAATSGDHTASEYIASLLRLGRSMFKEREIQPTWETVSSWLSRKPELLSAFRQLARQSLVVRIDNKDPKSRIIFRHDRVQDWILEQAVSEELRKSKMDTTAFSEPFFSDIVGHSLVAVAASEPALEKLRGINPLSLFYALQLFEKPCLSVEHNILRLIHEWLSKESSHARKNKSLRYAALQVLAETRSSHVPELLSKFPENSWTHRLAGLRNGDLISGVKLCAAIEPGTNAGWRDHAIEHVIKRFGEGFLERLANLLCRDNLSEWELVGSLRLAGHTGSTTLAPAIGKCWMANNHRLEYLEDFLWAAAKCGGTRTEELLATMCEAWATLPAEGEGAGHSPRRFAVGAHSLSWSFWRGIPEEALLAFIEQAKNDELCWPITYMLYGIDHPNAVEYIASYLATVAIKFEGTDNFSTFGIHVVDHWTRQQRDMNRQMSDRSRLRLQAIWTDASNHKHMRLQALKIWAATSSESDLPVLWDHSNCMETFDEVLRARLIRGDISAISSLIDKLREDSGGFWWQFSRNVWSEELTAVLDEQLFKRGAEIKLDHDCESFPDWITSELVIRMGEQSAEQLLSKHWQHLKFSYYFVQAALYVGTPTLVSLVEDTVRESQKPEELFRHIEVHFGIKAIGHPGIKGVQKLEVLKPYFHLFSQSSIRSFWIECNERGWFAFRQQYLDVLIRDSREGKSLDGQILVEELSKALETGEAFFTSYWVEDCLETGMSQQFILGLVRQWLRANACPAALELAASILIQFGSRKDLALLEVGNDGSSISREIIADTEYEVKRRTLN